MITVSKALNKHLSIDLKGHCTLGFCLAVISKVFKKFDVRNRAMVVRALQQWLQKKD